MACYHSSKRTVPGFIEMAPIARTMNERFLGEGAQFRSCIEELRAMTQSCFAYQLADTSAVWIDRFGGRRRAATLVALPHGIQHRALEPVDRQRRRHIHNRDRQGRKAISQPGERTIEHHAPE